LRSEAILLPVEPAPGFCRDMTLDEVGAEVSHKTDRTPCELTGAGIE
jgi:hypothetical protein